MILYVPYEEQVRSQTQTRFEIDDNFNFIVTFKSKSVGSNY
jgi:hypothetical protein